MAIVLGVDIGGTKIAAGLVDSETGLVHGREQVPTKAKEGGQAVLERALGLAELVLAKSGLRVLSIGVGAGGQIDSKEGVVVHATEILPGWAGVRLKDTFTKTLGLPTFVDNDVNALAVGESRFGAGKGVGHLAFLALGTGVGGALMHEGRLFQGPRGAGGELGHLILYPDAPPYENGTRGCLEQYVSGPAILRRWQESGGDVTFDGPGLAELARTGDPHLIEVLWKVGLDLGIGLATIANLFAPEAFILGGGVIDGFGTFLLEPAREALLERGLAAVRDTPVLLAALGPDAPLVGAASLAMPMKISGNWTRL